VPGGFAPRGISGTAGSSGGKPTLAMNGFANVKVSGGIPGGGLAPHAIGVSGGITSQTARGPTYTRSFGGLSAGKSDFSGSYSASPPDYSSPNSRITGGIAGLEAGGIKSSTHGMTHAYSQDFKVSGRIQYGGLAPKALGGTAAGSTGLSGGRSACPAAYSSLDSRITGGIAGLEASGTKSSTHRMTGAYSQDFKVSGGIQDGGLAPKAIGGTAAGSTGFSGGRSVSLAAYSSPDSRITGGIAGLEASGIKSSTHRMTSAYSQGFKVSGGIQDGGLAPKAIGGTAAGSTGFSGGRSVSLAAYSSPDSRITGGIAGLEASGIKRSTHGMTGAYSQDLKVSGGIQDGGLAPEAIGGTAAGSTGFSGGRSASPAAYSSPDSRITGGIAGLEASGIQSSTHRMTGAYSQDFKVSGEIQDGDSKAIGRTGVQYVGLEPLGTAAGITGQPENLNQAHPAVSDTAAGIAGLSGGMTSIGQPQLRDAYDIAAQALRDPYDIAKSAGLSGCEVVGADYQPTTGEPQYI